MGAFRSGRHRINHSDKLLRFFRMSVETYDELLSKPEVLHYIHMTLTNTRYNRTPVEISGRN